MPWELSSSIQPQDFTWSLYDLKNDFAQTKDLAASEPKRLADRKALFDSEAKRNNVYPLRANLDPVEAARMRRPEPLHANYVFWGGAVSLDRTWVVWGKCVSVRVDLGGCGVFKTDKRGRSRFPINS